jgi:hypothetical protein
MSSTDITSSDKKFALRGRLYVCVNSEDHRIDPSETLFSNIPSSDKKFGVALGDSISPFCVLLNRPGNNVLGCVMTMEILATVHVFITSILRIFGNRLLTY